MADLSEVLIRDTILRELKICGDRLVYDSPYVEIESPKSVIVDGRIDVDAIAMAVVEELRSAHALRNE